MHCCERKQDMKIHRILIVLTPVAAYLGYDSGPFVNFAYTSGTIFGLLLFLLVLMAVVRKLLKEQVVSKETLKDSLFLGIMVSLGIGIATYQSQAEMTEMKDSLVSILEGANEAELEFLNDESAPLLLLEMPDEPEEPNSPVSELTAIIYQIQQRNVELYNSYAEAVNRHNMQDVLVFENEFGKAEFKEKMSIINDLRRLTIEYGEGLESIQEFALNLASNSQYLDPETKKGFINGLTESRSTEIQQQTVALDLEIFDSAEMLVAHMNRVGWEVDDDLTYFDTDEDIDIYNQILNDITVISNQSSQLSVELAQLRQEVIGDVNDL